MRDGSWPFSASHYLNLGKAAWGVGAKAPPAFCTQSVFVPLQPRNASAGALILAVCSRKPGHN